MKLRAIPALRCGEFRYPVSRYISAVRDEKSGAEFAKRGDAWVIVCRRNHSVYRLEVERNAYRLFTALTSGKTMGDAVSSVRVKPEKLQEWFKSWVANRAFRAIEP